MSRKPEHTRHSHHPHRMHFPHGTARAKKLAAILHTFNLTVTKNRMTMLALLMQAREPLSAETIHKRTKREHDLVTVYRTLERFVEIGIARRVDLKEQHARYELTLLRPHHHHIVCRTCGAVEPVTVCDRSLDRTALRASKMFESIEEHALEFFGTCSSCGSMKHT